MSAAEQAVEQVAEVAEAVGEEAYEVAEAARDLAGRELTFAFTGVTIGTLIGVGVGYLVAKRRLESKYQKEAREEIDEMRTHFYQKERAREEQTDKPDLKNRVEALGYATKSAPDIETPEVPVDEADKVAQQTVVNVFNNGERGLSTGVWDYDKELSSRTPDRPYIIHREEFQQGHFHGEEYERTTLTYFSQDDVLANEADRPIDDIDETVGLENLEKFGHGSDDANIVYVRNDKLKTDFEIQQSGGAFTAEVLNEDEPDELEHSDTRRRRPQRVYDDGEH